MDASIQQNNLVHYSLGNISDLNSLIGHKVKISFTGNLQCIHCEESISKTFSAGSCYNCFRSKAVQDLCYVKPQLCHFHLGSCRESYFGFDYCMRPHTVYLSLTSGPKIGVTKTLNEHKRWIDQGATQAIALFQTQTRKQAGIIEEIISQTIADKTNWRKMLTENTSLDMAPYISEVHNIILNNFPETQAINEDVTFIHYPGSLYNGSSQIKSLSLAQHSEITDVLRGIKAQYLIFDQGVFNVRAHGGFEVQIAF